VAGQQQLHRARCQVCAPRRLSSVPGDQMAAARFRTNAMPGRATPAHCSSIVLSHVVPRALAAGCRNRYTLTKAFQSPPRGKRPGNELGHSTGQAHEVRHGDAWYLSMPHQKFLVRLAARSHCACAEAKDPDYTLIRLPATTCRGQRGQAARKPAPSRPARSITTAIRLPGLCLGRDDVREDASSLFPGRVLHRLSR